MPSLNRKEVPLWKGVSDGEWNDWKWQVANRIVTVDQLRQVIDIDDDEADAIGRSLGKLRMAITPYYASLMDPVDPRCPIRMQAVPTEKETRLGKADLLDPLHEDVDSPVPGLTHRYPDRGLFLITDPVSYTHLDVYKRQLLHHTHSHQDVHEGGREVAREVRSIQPEAAGNCGRAH